MDIQGPLPAEVKPKYPPCRTSIMVYVSFILSAPGYSRHCRGGRKSAFVRFTPLATIFGVGLNGR